MRQIARVLLALAVGAAVVLQQGEPAQGGCSPSYTIGDHAPLWSPTGDLLVFDRHDIGCGMPAYLMTIRAEGGAATRLPFFGRQRVEWLRDGSALLGNGLALVAPNGVVLRPPGRDAGSAAETQPSLSPDGSRVVFSKGPPFHLYVADRDAGNRRPLTSGAGEGLPVWSPRGDLIAFVVAGGFDVVRPDGTGRRAVWRGASPSTAFAWSPDGSKLAFLRRSDPRYVPDVLVVVDVHGRGVDELAAGPLVDRAPSWHPDGRLIAVTRSRVAREETEIVTVRSDGTGERVFGPGGELSWSPDGTRVAFVWRGRCPATRLGLYVAAADGSGARRLTNDCRFEGGSGADVLRGTGDDDVLFGRAGDDLLVDTYGEDVLHGGDGDDRLVGGEEGDLLQGARGSDLVRGGGGRDRIYGGPGADRIEAGIAKDTIYVGDGQRDVVICGPQLDLVVADARDRIARDCEDVRVLRR